MAKETAADDEVAKFLEELYKEGDIEMDEATIQMIRERNEESQRPSDLQSQSQQHAMITTAENNIEEPIESYPDIDSTSGSDDDSRNHMSNSFSRDWRSHDDSQSPWPMPEDLRIYHPSEQRSRPSSSSKDSGQHYSEGLSPGETSEQVQAEVPSPEPKPEESDDSSDLSSQSTGVKCSTIGLVAFAWLIVGVGLGVGFGIAAANKDDEPAASTADSTGGDKQDHDAVGAIKLLDSKDYFLFGGEELAATMEAIDVSACLEFCKEYDAMQYLQVQDMCACYNSVSCLMPWGPKVDTTNYQFVGDLYTKNELEECSEDYCQALQDKDGLCFTANYQDYTEYSLHGVNIVERESQRVETLEECLDLCSPYDTASFLNWKDCTCYDQAECWLEWGDSFDTPLLLGMVYSKKPLDVCLETYCEIYQDARCFKGNVQDSKEYSVVGTALTELNSTLVSSEEECLELCAPYDAASFRRPDVCTCYENPTCWLEWGENVDTSLFFGNVYSKTPLDFCEFDYCDVNNPDSLCFTGNEEDYRFYSLYGESMVEMASGQTPGSLQACLDLCAPYDAAAFENFADCSCYNSVQCLLRWGNEIDSDDFFGTVYTKRGLQECELDYCDAVGNDGLCFTGSTKSYSTYSLFGNNMEEMAASNDVKNKEECLDFCKEYDSAQYLNFQDPKCKCYNGAECWLAWPPDVTTSGVEYTGDVYSKEELQFCSFSYCSGNLCASGNNRQ
ncbi:unnamed protein product [Cylindrotheca closterium]|uniref:Uncharacterized protein n=1 Tax=Cylindrotheca closterium TaxID=2856 RepID=A0AAD2PWC4_9STRA|nr:unnamed protein product [Cylindrotheca closterium]